VAKFSIGRVFGGDVSFTYSFSLHQLEAEFNSVQHMKDWQIRAVGGVKILFLVGLLVIRSSLVASKAELTRFNLAA